MVGPSKSQKSQTSQNTLPSECPSQSITPLFLTCVHTFFQAGCLLCILMDAQLCPHRLILPTCSSDTGHVCAAVPRVTPDHSTPALTVAAYLPWIPLVPSGVPCWSAGPPFPQAASCWEDCPRGFTEYLPLAHDGLFPRGSRSLPTSGF